MSHTNPSGYLLDLSNELANSASPAKVRQLAGILVKNLIQNLTNDPLLEKVWERADPNIKLQVRNSTLGTLASEEKDVRLIAAQTVASIACIDIPKGQWLELLGILITNSTNLNKIFKVSAIRTLGYICEGLPEGTVRKEQADSILTALATSLDHSETDLEVKKVALDSLRNSLKFIRANIANESERSLILNLLFGCCSDQSVEIRKESMMIICDLITYYYDYIDTNLIELGALTYNSIRSNDLDVSIFAIEFWNQAADEEANRLFMQDKPCKNYISTAASTLVPLLLEKIHFFEQDQDDWNLHKACATTLTSISLIIHDAILPLVGDYITNYIKSPDYKYKTSAAVIIGSVVEGVNNAGLLINLTLTHLLELLSDNNSKVRETAAWSISKICEYHSKALIESGIFNIIFQETIKALSDKPVIATHGCWTIVNLLKKGNVAQYLDAEKANHILDSAIQAGLRPDANETGHEFLIAVYSLINAIVEEIPDSLFHVVVAKANVFLGLLERSITDNSQVPAQGHICSVLQTLFGRAPPGSIDLSLADRYVNSIITIFKHRHTVVEEGLQALGTLADNIGQRFCKYVELVIPFVEWCIESTSPSLCKSGVITCGDFSRALQDQFTTWIPRLLPKLLLILSSEQQMFEVKVRVIDTLSDLASHCAKSLKPFLPDIFKYIESASELSLNLNLAVNNVDMCDLLGELRESIMAFYVGIIQGVHENNEEDSILGYLPRLLDYTITVVQEPYRPNNDVHLNCIGVIGDLAGYYGSKLPQLLRESKITNYLTAAERIEDKSVRDILTYTKDRLKLI